MTINYKKEFYSLPTEMVNDLIAYAKVKQEKDHIVAEAIDEYIKERKKEKLVEDAMSIIGFAKGTIPNIQEIKANRYSI